MSETLKRIDAICRDRSARVKDLRAQGKKIVGYFCCNTPVEILTAAGLVPFRIMGKPSVPIAKADAIMEIIACPYVRNCLELGLQGYFDFLDGIVTPHSCDNIEKVYDIWREWVEPKSEYAHFFNIPHTISPPAFQFIEEELKTFKRSLENHFLGHQITPEELEKAIELHNRIRALVRELYELRKSAPPLLTGVESQKIVVSVLSLPAVEAKDLLEGAVKEIKERNEGRPGKKSVRLFVYGSELDDINFVETVEELDAHVVADDHCIGLRPFREDVQVSGNPVNSLAAYYPDKITCPRTIREMPQTHESDLENRFGYLREAFKDAKIDGVIIHHMRYCDTALLDLPDLKEFITKAGYPSLDIEDDYSVSTGPRMRIRVQAFIEMLNQKVTA